MKSPNLGSFCKPGTFFRQRIWLPALILFFVASALQAQDRAFEINGSTGQERLGSAITCAGTSVFTGVPGYSDFSLTGIGEVRVFDFTTKNLLYTIAHPFSQISAAFGTALKMFPDSNNNGLQEIVVGAPSSINFSTGSVFLFDHGGNQTPIRNLTGQTGDHFGESLALVDFPPSDGLADVMIGAPDRTGSGTGAVIIYDMLNSQTLLTISATTGITEFGRSLAATNDLDKNGSAEIVIGAPGAFDADGVVHIYSLATNNATLIREFRGTPNSDMRLGASVASVPDSTGDSDSEILIGSPAFNGDTGLIQLYSGIEIASAASTLTPLCEIQGTATGARFGASVSAIGDIDGDGLNDFAVGAPGVGNGEIHIYHYRPGVGCELVSTVAGFAGENLGRYVSSEPCGSGSTPAFKMVAGTDFDANNTGNAIVYNLLPTPTPTATPTPTPTPTPTATPTSTPAVNPSSAQLTFRISKTGEFRIVRTYDREPGSNCSATLYGRVQEGSKVYPIETFYSEKFSDTDTDERTSVIRLLNFPRTRTTNGVKPIINLMTETRCSEQQFDSNVFARYMNCGDPDQTVDIDTWVSTLKRALNTRGSTKASHAGKKVKTVRIKLRRFRK